MRNLQFGSAGPLVQMLQTALIRSGYLRGTPDGLFGKETEAALRRFQRSNGLTPDGIAGPLTYDRISNYLLGYAVLPIRPGDTYYRLAKAYGTTPEAILSANPGVDPLSLQPGQNIILPFGYDVVPTDIAFSYELLTVCLDGLQARYPALMRRSTIGTTSFGRNLYAFSIGSGTKNIAYNASHHANEWITTPLLLHFAEQYLKACIRGGRIGNTDAAELYREATVHFVPMVNPDGVNLVTGVYDRSDPEYRQALAIAEKYPEIPFPAGWKANLDGTDLNLNYPAGWNNAREIKFEQGFTSAAPRDYVGEAPLSAPESRAMAEFTGQGNFLLTLSYHTQGKVIYWRFLDYEPENAFSIGRTLAAVSGYSLENTPFQSGFAGYKDWYIQEFERPGYTVEAGSGENPLPIRDFAGIYRENENLLVQAALLA